MILQVNVHNTGLIPLAASVLMHPYPLTGIMNTVPTKKLARESLNIIDISTRMENNLEETIACTFTLAESGGLPETHRKVLDTLLVLLLIVVVRTKG